MERSYALFPTSIGEVGLVWTARGIAGLQIPERDAEATLHTLRRRFPDAKPGEPTAEIRVVMDEVRALLTGGTRDLAHLRLDLDGVSAFERSVYDLLLTIPPGRTMTYGEMAKALGDPGAARAVGVALGRNPVPIIVPCHRVLAAGGRSGGFSAPGGAETKLRLLAIEKADPNGQPDLFR